MALYPKSRDWLDRARDSRTVLLAVIYFTNFLDYLLLTAVVPIIPDFLVDADRHTLLQESFHNNSLNDVILRNQTVSLTLFNGTRLTNSTSGESFMERILSMPVRAINENSRVGWILSSKAIVQLIANPIVGLLSNRVSYYHLLMFGVMIFLGSSTIFAAAESFIPLLLARAVQGIGSAATTIAGMSMIADKYPDDGDRSRAMGTAMGGLAMGILVGYPFGGLLYAVAGKAVPFIGIALLSAVNIGLQITLMKPGVKYKVECKPPAFKRLLLDPYILICAGAIMVSSMSLAVLESTVPIWVMDTMRAQQWELGVIFIPDSIGYLIGTNCFPVIAKTYGRWLFTSGSLLLIVVGLIAIPFCSSIIDLITPHLCLGLGVGVADAAIMPLLALLVDRNHIATYGSVYSVVQLSVCLAYSLGPAISGLMVKTIGFKWSMWGMAVINFLFTPLNYFLRSPPIAEDKTGILQNADVSEEDKENIHLTDWTSTCSSYRYNAFNDVNHDVD